MFTLLVLACAVETGSCTLVSHTEQFETLEVCEQTIEQVIDEQSLVDHVRAELGDGELKLQARCFTPEEYSQLMKEIGEYDEL